MQKSNCYKDTFPVATVTQWLVAMVLPIGHPTSETRDQI